MNKPLSKILQNIDMIETLNFGVSKCYWSEEKTNFKDMHFHWNLQTLTDKSAII